MANLPEIFSFKFVLEKSNKPIANLATMLILYANRKNDYSIGPKISDEDGIVAFTKSECLKEIEVSKKTFLMDYSSSLVECLPKFTLRIINMNQIDRIIEYWKENKQILSKLYNNDDDFYLKKLPNVRNSNFKEVSYDFSEEDLPKNNLIEIKLKQIKNSVI